MEENKEISMDWNAKRMLFNLLQLAGDYMNPMHKREEDYMDERRIKLNRKFNKNKKNISKLRKLNQVLKQKEELILKQCCSLEDEIYKVNNTDTPYNDYNINIEIWFYSSSINSQFKSHQLDMIYLGENMLSFCKKEHESIDTKNGNWINFSREFGDSIFWNQFNFKDVTRTFYELTCNSNLALEDIVQIDAIWWTIKVDYQYNEKFKL